MPNQAQPSSRLAQLLHERILILDGAMGTMIQRYRLEEADYRGERFKDWPSDLKGNNDLLVLTKPAVIREIHEQYLEAGADILETNTFNGNRLSQADYGLQDYAAEIDTAAALLARECADRYTALNPAKPRFVAGVLGPDQQDGQHLAGGERSGRPQHPFRRTGDHLCRGDPRTDRRAGGRHPDRDHLRYPERQGRGLRGGSGLRGGRSGAAGDDLRDHHGRLRPHPVGPDGGSLLQQPAPCPTPVDRAQLRARAGCAAAACRGHGAGGRVLYLIPPQCGPAE